MAGGFEVELDVLLGAAEGVSQTCEDMKSCQVTDLCGPAADYGHDGLHDAFQHFCDRWQSGIDILLDDGEAISTALHGAAAAYIDTDYQAEDVLKGSGTDPATGALQ